MNKNPSLRDAAEAIQLKSWITPSCFALLAVLAMTLWIQPLHAAEKRKIEITIHEDGDVETTEIEAEQKPDAAEPPANTARFAPDFCDFEITFPETPVIAEKCIAESQCYEVNSYTMVYGMQSTVDVSATCSPSTPENYKRYTDHVMKAALYGMIDSRNLTEHDIKFNQLEKTKSASITGTGITGSNEKIYTGQLWVGPNSVFTVQAELVGGAHEVADKSFADILGSIKIKEGKQVPKPKKPKMPQANNQ